MFWDKTTHKMMVSHHICSIAVKIILQEAILQENTDSAVRFR